MKDLNYIIKRIIIGVAIALILMTIKANAEEYGNIANINVHTQFNQAQVKIIGLQGASDFTETNASSNTLLNYGKGFIIFSYAYYSEKNTGASGNTYSAVINSVSIKSGDNLYACEIGNLEPYSDSGVQWKQATAKCYVNLGSYGLQRIRFQVPYQPANNTTYILISRYATFVGASTPTSNQDVVSAITTQTSLQQQELQTQREIKQAIQEQTAINQQQLQEQQNTNNLINDDSPADDSEISSALDTGNLPGGQGPLASLVSLPITIVNNVLTGLGLSCTDLSIPIPFVSQTFTIPCVARLFSELGWSTYYEIIGALAGGILLLKYLIYLYDRLSDILYLEDKGLIGKVA